MEWTTSCLDWEDRIVARRSLVPKPLFQSEADAALAVFDELRIVDAPGSPTFRDACKPWFRDFVAAIFGSYDQESGARLIRDFYMLISKKNAKSTGAAGIMMTALLRNWRESGEFLMIAPTREVADNSFKPAADMVRKDEELNDLLQVQSHIRTITHRETKATLKVLAADSDTVSGNKAIGVLIDEHWLFGKRANAESMLREATGGLASRPEGFVIYMTTQADDPPAGDFRTKLQYARGVRDGLIDDNRFLPVLYEFPERMLRSGEHRETKNFYITNPNMGASVDESFLVREMSKAEIAGEDSVRGFLAKHLNVEIGLALRSDRWAGADFWEAAGRTMTLEELIERSEVIDIGIDGGGLDDLLGFAVIGREEGTGTWLHWGRAWAHPSVLERRKSEAERIRDFAKDGDLSIVEKMGDDVDQLTEIVMQVYESGLLDKIGVDQAGIGAILTSLVAAGIPQDSIIGIPQGWRLSGAIKTAERKLAEGALEHCAQPLMAWSVGNAKVEPRGNAILITKQASGTAKIDPLMSLFNAVSLMSLNPASSGKSFWETA